jgi:hypothetical protein
LIKETNGVGATAKPPDIKRRDKMSEATAIKILNQLENAERNIRIPGECDDDIIVGGECLIEDGLKTIDFEIMGDRPISNRIRVKYPLGLNVVLDKEAGDEDCQVDVSTPSEDNPDGYIYIPRCFPTKWKLIISIDTKGKLRPKAPPNVTIEDDQ